MQSIVLYCLPASHVSARQSTGRSMNDMYCILAFEYLGYLREIENHKKYDDDLNSVFKHVVGFY